MNHPNLRIGGELEVTFDQNGRVIPFAGRPAVLFGRSLSTYQDLPEPIASAVGKVMAEHCEVVIGYRCGTSGPLIQARSFPESIHHQSAPESNTPNIKLVISERNPHTVSDALAINLTHAVSCGGVPLRLLNDLLQSKNPLNDPEFKEFNSTAIQAGSTALRQTCLILNSMIRSPVNSDVKDQVSLAELFKPGSDSHRWVCTGTESLTFCGNGQRLKSLFGDSVKGCFSHASILWAEESQTLGVPAVRIEVTEFGWTDNWSWAWMLALKDLVVDAQGQVELLPSTRPTCVRVWLPLNLPDSF